jgi:hypothetical protein
VSLSGLVAVRGSIVSLENQPFKDPNPEKDNPSLSELYRPPRVKGRAKVDALFESGRPEDYEAIGRLIYETPSDRLRSYIGLRLAGDLSPEKAGLACDVIRHRSFQGIHALLCGLAKREFAAILTAEPSVIEGPAYRELRQLIAEVAVEPEFAFMDRERKRFEDLIPCLTSFPITILRRSAGKEIEPALVGAVTRGGLCVDKNRRGLELLILRESASTERVLSDEAIVSIARVLNDPLRDPFTRVLVVSLLDKWLSKQQPLSTQGDIAIRDQLHADWLDYSIRPPDLAATESLRILDTVRLLRHFEDPVTGLALRKASLHPHPTIALVAKLILPDQREAALTILESRLLGDAPQVLKVQTLRVFGQPISAELDEDLWPIFDRYIRDAWDLSQENDADEDDVATARVIVLQSTLRRFFSEPLSGPFLSNLFASFKAHNPPMSTVAVNTLTRVASLGQIPFLSFYEDMSNMGPVFESARILWAAVEKDPSNKGAQRILQKLEEVFVHQGPASYGFEMEFNYRGKAS